MIRQKPVKGGRKQVAGGVIAEIERHVQADMRKFKCGKSFIVSTVLAAFYGVDIEKFYEADDREKRVRTVGRRLAREDDNVVRFKKQA